MRLLFLLLVFPLSSFAVTYLPWYGKTLELETEAGYTYSYFDAVDRGGKRRFVGDQEAHLLKFNARLPYEPWRAELGLAFSNNSRQTFGWDHFELTGNYRFTDDLVGDYVTALGGITLRFVSNDALKDLHQIFHGKEEFEFFVSVGKEDAYWQHWLSRLWGAFGFGFADRGSPWIFLKGHWEKNCQDFFWWGLFAHSDFGFGDQKLCPESFKGYGKVQVRSLDLGADFHAFLCDDFSIEGSYTFRLFARNCPRYAHRMTLALVYPFGF